MTDEYLYPVRRFEVRQARIDGFIWGFLVCAIIAVAVARW